MLYGLDVLMLLLSRILNTALVGAVVLLGVVWFYKPANASTVLQGSVVSVLGNSTVVANK